MRILDVGSHDGFLSTWLVKQLREEGKTVERLDGIEANSKAVGIANRRLDELGVEGRFEIGLAEDATMLFAPGTYDAVIACEIIEHVPDVDKFLDVLEYMLAPNGVIFISTPDGTFGNGQNPHHLRAYRAIDLFEVLRRRGEVLDMEVGIDTITSACYRPSFRGGPEVAIYCGPGWMPWHPTDIENKGLGGSETAAARLAEALSDLGYIVTVYGEMSTSGPVGQVSYRSHHVFDPTDPRYMTIVSRQAHMLDRPINSEKVVFWAHDTDYGPAVTPERFARADAVMTLSEWHRDHWLQYYPFTENKVHVTRNGIKPEYFTREVPGLRRNPKRAIFSSSPDRGLDFILELWPRVREQVPEAELFYCYSDVYDRVADTNAIVRDFRKRVQKLAEQPGVHNLGSLPQQGLALAMRESGIWLAPSYHSPGEQRFHETYCIGAVEAAAAGCSLVMSPWGALKERAKEALNYAYPLSDDDRPDADAWVKVIVELMQYPTPHEASSAALAQTWDGVAHDIIAAADSQN